MRKLIYKIVKSNTLKSVGIVLGGNFISVILGFWFVILTARVLGPAQFGVFSTILAYSIFISAISDLGVSQSIVKFFHETKNIKEQKNWVGSGFFSVLLSSIIISLISTLIYHFGLRNLWDHQSDSYSFALFAMNIVITINTFFLAYFQSKEKFLKRALIDNLFSLSRILLTLYILYVGRLNVTTCLWIIVLAYIIAIITALFISKQGINLGWMRLSEIISLLKFGKWLALNSIFANLYGKLDLMMLAWLVTAYDTGQYSAASRFITIFPLVVSSISSVAAPRLAQFNIDLEVKKYVKKMYLLLVGISIGMLSLVILGPFIILTAYSAEFRAAVPMFQLLVISYIPLVITIPAGNALIYFYKKPNLISAISFIQLVGLFFANLALIPHFHAYGVIISLAMMNILGMLGQYYYFKKETKI